MSKTIEKLENEINELINNLRQFLNEEYSFNQWENRYFTNYLKGKKGKKDVDDYKDLPNINKLNVNIDNLPRELSALFFSLMTAKVNRLEPKYYYDIITDREKNQKRIDEYLTKIFELKKQIKKMLVTAQLSIREKLTRGDALPVELVKEIGKYVTGKKGGKRKSRKSRKHRKSKKSRKSRKFRR
jgi:hypothetical protein